MGGLGLLIPLVLLAALFFWFRSARGEGPVKGPAHGRISLATEALGYVGAILVLAGAGAALVQRWDDLGDGARLAFEAGLALFFLGVGFLTRRSTEPASLRLTSVLWLLSTAAAAGALAQLAVSFIETSDETAFLIAAAGAAAWAGVLYVIQHTVLKQLALYLGVLLTGLAAVLSIDPEAPAWIGSMVAWAIGVAWLVLGERRLLVPWWVAIPIGMLTVLIAPSAMAEDTIGVMYAVGIATGAGLMAFGVRSHYVPGLALGALGLFAYVTSAVVHYFGDSLGVPAALAITGAVILLIAAVTSRLARVARTPQPKPS